MKSIALLGLCIGCTTGEPESVTGIYQVSARMFDPGSVLCTAPGSPTPPAVPDFQLTKQHGQLAWAWCDSPAQCDPIGTTDWFDPDGDHWTRAAAFIGQAPDNGGPFCSYNYDTLAIHQTGANVHVDLERKIASGPVDACTPADATAKLAADVNCFLVDRYDLVPL